MRGTRQPLTWWLYSFHEINGSDDPVSELNIDLYLILSDMRREKLVKHINLTFDCSTSSTFNFAILSGLVFHSEFDIVKFIIVTSFLEYITQICIID